MYVSSEGELAVLFARGPCAVRRPLAAAWPKNTKAPSPAAPDHLSSRPRLLPWRAGGAMSAEPTAGRGRPPPAAGAGGTATNEGSSRSRPHRAPPQRAAVDPTKCLPPSAFRLPPSVASACGYYAVPRRLRQLRNIEMFLTAEHAFERVRLYYAQNPRGSPGYYLIWRKTF
ncbi:hypothetical protein GUJ93_ZPchr0002g23887 [Zizania palustris]|uniref:Uncharacterized protein n=1 Tax=Zizania palustris TaxID=103762 RepID=A0A8J5RXP5_ZIZPA|nr:hypothetical protein GUJ93_ZPchr0002g23887 [Zizania palustris]